MNRNTTASDDRTRASDGPAERRIGLVNLLRGQLDEDVLLDRLPDAEEIVVVPDKLGRPVPVVCMAEGKRSIRSSGGPCATVSRDSASRYRCRPLSCTAPRLSRHGAVSSPRCSTAASASLPAPSLPNSSCDRRVRRA